MNQFQETKEGEYCPATNNVHQNNDNNNINSNVDDDLYNGYKEELNEIWSTFRLPVPLSGTLGGSSSLHQENDGAVAGENGMRYGVPDEWLLQALELLRLVNIMKHPPQNQQQYHQRQNKQQQHQNYYMRSTRSKEQIMKSQMKLAYSLLETAERTFPLPQHHRQQQKPHTLHQQLPQHSPQKEEQQEQLIFHDNIYKLLDTLRNDTISVCTKFQSRLDRHYSSKQQQQQQQLVQNKNHYQQSFDNSAMPGERDSFDDIFFSSDQDCPFLQSSSVEERDGNNEPYDDNEEDYNDFDENEGHDYFEEEKHTDPSSPAQKRAHHNSRLQQHQQQQRQKQRHQETNEIDPIEFQKQQQHLLEEELSSLAARLKSSTLAMNATLQTQTHDLEDMEQLAQNNLDSVSSTTQKVENRLKSKKGWKKRFATWSLIGSVVGMFVFCFLVMRTVPKRRIGTIGGSGGYGGRGSGGISASNLWNKAKSYLPNSAENRQQREQRQREEMAKEREQRRREQINEEKARMAYEKQQQERRQEEREQEQLRETKKRQQQEREEQKRQQQEQQYRKKHMEQQCEILGDGSQICSEVGGAYKNVDIKAHERAAEQKRRRIEEKMANAPIVVAIDVTEEESKNEQDDTTIDGQTSKEGTSEGNSGNGQNDGKENNLDNHCISPTDKIQKQRLSLKSLMQSISNINASMERTTTHEEKIRFVEILERMRSGMSKVTSELEMAKNEAKTNWWRIRSNQIYVKESGKSLGSIPFCGDEAFRDLEGLEEGEENEKIAAAEERQKIAAQTQRRQEEERRLKEEQQKEELEKEAERVRLLEAARLAEQSRIANEKARLAEQNRIAMEEKKKKLAERIEKERAEAEEKARLLAAKEKESERLRLEEEKKLAEKKRIEEEERMKKIEEMREKERVEAEARVAAEKTAKEERLKLERERLEAELLAAEERTKQEIENIKMKAILQANQAMELANEITLEDPEFIAADVRFAAGRIKNDLLAHYVAVMPDMVDASDGSGWRPIHEAARSGNVAGVQLLVSAGCDLTSRTGRGGKGGTALWWALQRYGESHDVVKLLRAHGAPDTGPEM